MTNITLGGGCFWCTEAVFLPLRGVRSVVSGYAGGDEINWPNPNYEMICTGRSGYAEVIQISFDEAVISLDTVLDVFFATHDPTTLNRQGADRGTQYRSVIFTENTAQHEAAAAAIARLQPYFDAPIVTEVSPLPTFYRAEDYHQNYYAQHPSQGYCMAVINPKLAKLRSKYAELLA